MKVWLHFLAVVVTIAVGIAAIASILILYFYIISNPEYDIAKNNGGNYVISNSN